MGVDEIKEGLVERAESSGNLDYEQLITQTDTISTVTSLVLGILTTAILVLIPLIAACEISYICFPIIREKVDELIIKLEGRGSAHKVLGFTFRDAFKAVEEANTVEIGQKSALLIYLQLKMKSLQFLMFIIALAVSGSSAIIDLVSRAIDGIMSLFS